MSEIMDRAVLMSVEFKSFGTRRKVDASDIGSKDSGAAIETDADREAIRATKAILESATLKSIKKSDGALKEWIARRTLPSQFRAGIYAVKNEMVEEVDTRIEEHKRARDSNVRQFVEEEYEACKLSAQTKLGPLFDEKNYPSAGRVAAAFDIVTGIIFLETPGKLKTISRAIYDREVAKAKERVATMEESCKDILRAEFLDLTAHLTERLSAKPDGSQKIFKKTLVGNVQEFLDLFSSRSIADDEELAALVTEARGIIAGVSPERLRDDTILRERVAAGFSEVKARLDSMMTDRPKRVITFDDEPAQDSAAA